MKFNRNILRRPAALVSALALVGITLVPVLAPESVSAVTTHQVTSRSITMSDSTAAATNVTYALTITTLDASQSMVIDFCGDSPIIGGACNVTTNLATSPQLFDASGAAYSASAPVNANGTTLPIPGGAGTAPTGWTLATASATTLKLTASGSQTAGTYTWYFTGITNKAVNGTFYARVYTYTDATYGSTATPAVAYASPTTPGTYIDYGGFALSTANNVSITAIVMETLTFCVSKSAPGPGCGTSGQAVDNPALTLGHGTPKALDTSAIDTDTAYTQLSTNALHGAVVALKTVSSTTCSGLSRDGGSTCDIPANGATGPTVAIAAGTAHFGLAATAVAGGIGTITATAPYDGSVNYFMGTAKPIGDFGDQIESTTGACQDVNELLTYGATASATTPAGVYGTTEAMIATGTF